MTEPTHEIVMPFVTVTSKGGPHDDDAYAAGYECGRLDGWLSVISALGQSQFGDWRPAGDATVQAANLPQIDLIAMRHGYQVERQDSGEHEGWAIIRLTPGEEPQ